MTEAGRFQVENRALRLAQERAIGALLEIAKRTWDVHAADGIVASIAVIRETACIDFSCPIQRDDYRTPGGCREQYQDSDAEESDEDHEGS